MIPLIENGKRYKCEKTIDQITYAEISDYFSYRWLSESKGERTNGHINQRNYIISIQIIDGEVNECDHIEVRGRLYEVEAIEERPNRLNYNKKIRIASAVRC